MLAIAGFFFFGLQQQLLKLYEEHFRARAYTQDKTIDNKRLPYIGSCAKVHVLSHESKSVNKPGALFKAGKWINRLDYLEVNGETLHNVSSD